MSRIGSTGNIIPGVSGYKETIFGFDVSRCSGLTCFPDQIIISILFAVSSYFVLKWRLNWPQSFQSGIIGRNIYPTEWIGRWGLIAIVLKIILDELSVFPDIQMSIWFFVGFFVFQGVIEISLKRRIFL